MHGSLYRYGRQHVRRLPHRPHTTWQLGQGVHALLCAGHPRDGAALLVLLALQRATDKLRANHGNH